MILGKRNLIPQKVFFNDSNIIILYVLHIYDIRCFRLAQEFDSGKEEFDSSKSFFQRLHTCITLAQKMALGKRHLIPKRLYDVSSHLRDIMDAV